VCLEVLELSCGWQPVSQSAPSDELLLRLHGNGAVLAQMELYEAKMKSALCLQQLERDPTHMLQVGCQP
jgi:hypothetical protein